jgi:DedD protein
MADRIPDNADLAVDELRRKARRRLVGAVVLALAAAIIVPLLLEKEPKPLGDEVSVQIPPVDEGRFVNRLTGTKSKEPAKEAKAEKKGAEPAVDKGAAPTAPTPPVTAEAPVAPPAPTSSAPVPASQPIVSAPPGKSLAEAEQRVLSPATKSTPKAEAPAKPAAPAESPPQPMVKSTPAPASAPAPTSTAPTATAPEKTAPEKTAPTAKTEAKPDTAAPAAAPAGYAVQLAAFADDKGANALAAKLRKSGYAAYTEAVQTSRGTLWRVRVGGYPTREAAVAARDKLKAEGQNGIVAPAK